MLAVVGLVVFVAAWSVIGSLVWVLVLLGAAVVGGFGLAEAYRAADDRLSARRELERIQNRTYAANRQLADEYVVSQFKAIAALDWAAHVEQAVPGLTRAQKLAIRAPARRYLNSL